MAKIYISSTYQDLKDYREKLKVLLQRLGHEEISPHQEGAEEQLPVDKYLADVGSCDVYVGIFAWRYGWIPETNNPSNVSITELEYRRALVTGKPCLIFVLSDEAPWPAKFIDTDRTRIEKLRNELAVKHVIGVFKNADDLARLVGESIHAWETKHGYSQHHASRSELDFKTYYAALAKRYQALDLDALAPPTEAYFKLQLASVFVEQSVRENPQTVEITTLHEEIQTDKVTAGVAVSDRLRNEEMHQEKPRLRVLDVITENNKIVLLGDPGSGKSMLARYLVLSLVADADDNFVRQNYAGYLPLLVELRSFARSYRANASVTFLEFIEYVGRTEGWSLEREALHDYLKADGRALVIFDGLDEIFEIEDRELIARHIVEFAARYPQVHVIVTSRIVGYRRSILQKGGFAHFALQDFNDQQVAMFLERWSSLSLTGRTEEGEGLRERVMGALRESTSIRQLAGNPMLLTMMALIVRHEELPRERWKLYEHAAGTLLQDWDVKKHLPDRNFLTEEDKKELLRRLAYRMQSSGGGPGGNYIRGEQLREEFEEYLKQQFDQSPITAARNARAIIQEFRERNFILTMYAPGVYCFVHRAFFEYFCATAFIYKFEKTREITLEDLKRNVFGAHWGDQSWHEVLRLISWMIDEKFAREIILYLTDLSIDWSPETPSIREPWNIALAVQCVIGRIGSTTLQKTAVRLLEAVYSLFVTYDRALSSGSLKELPITFLEQQILEPIESLESWPYRIDAAAWLKRRDLFDAPIHSAALLARFIGSVARDEEKTYQELMRFAESNNASYRTLALYALPVGWRTNESTLILLHRTALYDTDAEVRCKSLQILIKYYRDDRGTLPLIRNISETDAPQFEVVRALAISEMARGWPNDMETLSIVDFTAVDAQSEVVREAAKTAGLHLRKQRVESWISWLSGDQDESDFYKLPAAADGFPVIFVRSIRLQNIKAFVDTGDLNVCPTGDRGNHLPMLLLGDNAAGKSTLLRCFALAALGSELANQVEKRPEGYLRYGSDRGLIEVSFDLQLDHVTDPSALGTFYVGLEIRKGENSFRGIDDTVFAGQRNAVQRLNWLRRLSDDKFGFVCGYGALRSMSDDPNLLQPEEPKESLERVISLFRANAPLIDPDVLSKMLMGDLSNFRNLPQKLLDPDVLKQLGIHLQTLLPGITSINNPPFSVMTLHSIPIALRELSDGYGSILALIGHLFRHSLAVKNWHSDPATAFGVVLIDEIDLHLHPEWQQSLIYNLSRVFPNMQFIATTHSPLVVGGLPSNQVIRFARNKKGEVVRELIKSDMTIGYADQILTSNLFGLETTLDKFTQIIMDRYQELLARDELNTEEQNEYEALEQALMFRVPPPSGTYVERHEETLSQAKSLQRIAEQLQTAFPRGSQSLMERANRLLSDIEGS